MAGQEPVNFLDNLNWDIGTVERQMLAVQHVSMADIWPKAGDKPKLWRFRNESLAEKAGMQEENGEDMQIRVDKKQWTSWEKEIKQAAA